MTASVAVSPVVLGPIDVTTGFVLVLMNVFALLFAHRAVRFGLLLLLLNLLLLFLQSDGLLRRQLAGPDTLTDSLLLILLTLIDSGCLFAVRRSRRLSQTDHCEND